MTASPFDALGLPARPDLTDEQVRAAWRKIAATTHPDRSDGGDVARYTAAAAAYAQLRSPWGRSEAWADLSEARADMSGARADVSEAGAGLSEAWGDLSAGADDTAPLPAVGPAGSPPAAPVGPGRLLADVRHLPARIRHGRPLRLLLRALAAVVASLAVLDLIPGQPAAPAMVTGLVTWFALTSRADLAPPPER